VSTVPLEELLENALQDSIAQQKVSPFKLPQLLFVIRQSTSPPEALQPLVAFLASLLATINRNAVME
jgi:hypothetical protein